jgi:uncharacterized membrane protein YfhO
MALRNRRLWPLTAAVCVPAYANVYFFYILAIVVVLYTVLRYFEITKKEERWRRLVPTALRVGGYYLLGLALAAPMLATAGAAVTATARSQAEYSTGLFYSATVYRTLLAGLGSAQPGPIATYMGFGVLGLLMVAVLFVGRGANTTVKAMIGVLVASICLPVAGSIFNGLTFPSNRFAFSLGVFVALAAALRLSDKRPFASVEIKAMA